MFGGKKKKPQEEAQEPSARNDVLSLKGQMVGSSRFKTWCVLFLFIIVIFQCVFITALLGQRKIVVGITAAGEPQLLRPVTAELSLDVFVRDFSARFFSFSPSTVRENMRYARDRITSGLAEVYSRSMGEEFFTSVTELGIVQITTIRDIQIFNLTDSGFTALVTAGRIKSDAVEKQTVEQTVYISMRVAKGPITYENPWGYYVDEIHESLTKPNIR